ncbi:hypothetical protein [Paraburkholderia tropica]|nr:hypothetical protein [Paraburkholderia tropica]
MLTFTPSGIAYHGLQQKKETIVMTSPYVFALIAALAAMVASSLAMLLIG